MNAVIENKYAKFLSFGLFMITVLIVAGPVADPVNVPKLLLLGGIAFGMIPFLLQNRTVLASRENRIVTFSFLIFVSLSIISTLLSDSPISQNLYGIAGRNTGLVAYISFALIFLSASLIRNIRSIEAVILAFAVSALINITYGFVEHFIGDPIPWTNIYGALLGTFGNPDFAGAFYGMTTATFASLVLGFKKKLAWRIAFSALFMASFACVIFTKTKQGLLVAAISVFIVLLLFVISEVKNKLLTLIISVLGIFSFIFSLLGMLQKGPLSGFLYKESVSLRGSYWDAAFETGKKHIFTGVGFDSFGDWYRRTRSIKAATWLPGPEVFTNAAHNYYLDIFASGGILLFLSYCAFTLIGLVSSIRIIRNLKYFDYRAAVLISGFVGFQAQSIISIPQIGLAIWGWVFSGLLYSLERILSFENSQTKVLNSKKFDNDVPTGIFIFAGFVLGIFISVPPYSADATWMSATKSQDLRKVEAALVPNYFNPSSVARYLSAVTLLEHSKLFDESHKYALVSVKFNHQSAESWKAVYFATKSSDDEKKIALENLKRLDPLNRNLEKLK
jgi:O-antigen ligase